MLGSKKLVMPIETSFQCWAVFIVFASDGRVIYGQTMVQCAAFGCNNKSGNPGVEGSGKVHSFHSFPIKRPPLLKKWLTKLDRNSSAFFVASCSIIIRLAFFKCHNDQINMYSKALARDPSASLEDWQKLAKTGKKIGFIMGEIGKRLAKF